jgi:diguanylate cyclase (GGDEF)-like protein/PAS domain S-box-containing protein
MIDDVGKEVARPQDVYAAMRDASAELASAKHADAVFAAISRAVARLVPSGVVPEVCVVMPDATQPWPESRQSADGSAALVAIQAKAADLTAVGLLYVDAATAAQPDIGWALESLSAQAAMAMEKLRLADEVERHQISRQIEALIEQSGEVALILDRDDRIRYASPSARNLFGTAALEDSSMLDLVEAKQRSAAAFLLRYVRSGGMIPSGGRADWTVLAADGRAQVVEVLCREFRPGDPAGVVALTMRDVTAQRWLEHQLTERIFHDAVTGLPNRAVFAERVENAISKHAGLVAVVLLDLDKFGTINDSLGHAVGDNILRIIGRRIRDAVGAHQLVARLGGDEFAVLVHDARDPAEAGHVAALICECLAPPMRTTDGTVVVCRASVGVDTTAQAGSVHELLRNANLALRSAKAAGGGQWRLYDPAMGERVRHSELRSDLGRAIDEGGLFLEYQPIVALNTGAAVGFEALVRWRHPTRGRLPPSEFIDIAEESGLIVPIGEWVLGAAMAAAQGWYAIAGKRAPYVSVNVSAAQFRSDDFVRTVRRLLGRVGLPAQRLVLEVTESLGLREDDPVWDALGRLRGDGVRVAIDDFGTGYSALGYLRQIPLDIVKLDRLFVRGLTKSRRQRDLVEGIVALTRNLNLDVIAEGIETERQRQVCAAAGCVYGQGFLFSVPLAEPDTVRWLSSGRDAPPV